MATGRWSWYYRPDGNAQPVLFQAISGDHLKTANGDGMTANGGARVDPAVWVGIVEVSYRLGYPMARWG